MQLKRVATLTSVALTALLLVSSSSGAQDEPELSAPVVGPSTFVAPGEAPAVAFVEAWWGSESATCTGTLVDADWVLTAAHCVMLEDGSQADEVNVVVGSVDAWEDYLDPIGTPAPGVELHRADGWVVHGNPSIGPEAWFNDVAMVHLPSMSAITPMSLTTDTSLVEPAKKNDVLPARFFGFGLHNCPPSCEVADGFLRRGDTWIYSDDFIDEAFNGDTIGVREELGKKELARNIFLLPNLGFQGGGCFGDSGGPMVVFDGSGWKLAGVSSFIVSQTPGACDGFIGNINGDLFILHAVADLVGSPLGRWVRSIINADERCAGRPVTLAGSSSGDIIVGTGVANVIDGRGGRDKIIARGGPDTVCGGSGADLIRAGRGRDVVHGQKGSDIIEGRGGADDIKGGAGDDVIDGGGSGDRINGQNGRDVISGGKGPDVIEGGAKGDHIEGNGGRDDIHAGSGADVVEGGKGDDVIRGGSGSDDLFGNSGDDVIRGGRGDDTCHGGPGQNILISC